MLKMEIDDGDCKSSDAGQAPPAPIADITIVPLMDSGDESMEEVGDVFSGGRAVDGGESSRMRRLEEMNIFSVPPLAPMVVKLR